MNGKHEIQGGGPTEKKLSSILPCVRSYTTYPEIAIIGHAIGDTTVYTCVTVTNRLKAGVLGLP